MSGGSVETCENKLQTFVYVLYVSCSRRLTPNLTLVDGLVVPPRVENVEGPLLVLLHIHIHILVNAVVVMMTVTVTVMLTALMAVVAVVVTAMLLGPNSIEQNLA